MKWEEVEKNGSDAELFAECRAVIRAEVCAENCADAETCAEFCKLKLNLYHFDTNMAP